MVYQVRVCTILVGDLSSDPSIPMRWLTTVSNFSSKQCNIFLLLWETTQVHTYI